MKFILFSFFASIPLMGMEVNMTITTKAYKGVLIGLTNVDKITVKDEKDGTYSKIVTSSSSFSFPKTSKKYVSDVVTWAKQNNLIQHNDSLSIFYAKNSIYLDIKSIKENTSLKKITEKYKSLYFVPKSNVQIFNTFTPEKRKTIYLILWHKCFEKNETNV